ncbi:phosphoribosyl-AMP cyclohydrolase [Qipengyuania sp. DSG2-2]|uniref:phosphoribosyl-AMP cyclohydrolase n=1 Tax=Qipengyuania sp. DGS2-2 TaxID=3349631 RepID=UPI0036D43D5C
MKKVFMVPALGAVALTLAACGETGATDDAMASTEGAITAAEVEAAQQAWGEGIVAIGQVFTEEGDYSARATEHINTHYAYGDDQTILFKPTLAAEDQFRESFDEALSYFVGTEGTEDGGFAIAPYTAVRWENNGTIIDEDGDMAMAMGNYYFTGTDGAETKVEYTFGYEKDDAGDLKIVLHHSSLPYSAN